MKKSNRKKTDKKQKGVYPLTYKEREVIRKITTEKMTPTRAVMQTYDTDKPTNAGAIWNTLKKKPKVQMALMSHSDLAEQVIVNTMAEFSTSQKQWERTLAVDNAKWLHDKVHGKAVQQTSNVNLNFTQHAQQKAEEYGL